MSGDPMLANSGPSLANNLPVPLGTAGDTHATRKRLLREITRRLYIAHCGVQNLNNFNTELCRVSDHYSHQLSH